MFEKLHNRILEFDTALEYDFSIDNNPSRIMSNNANYKDYQEVLDPIFNVALQTFYVCSYYMVKNVSNHENEKNIDFSMNQEMFLIFMPLKDISEEICLQIQTQKVSIPTLSLFGRQIIEQAILISEVYKQQIPFENLVIASVASHNNHVGSEPIELNASMNPKNKGLFKAFRQRTRPERLVKNYNVSFLYNLFSGNIHSPSSISSYEFRAKTNHNGKCKNEYVDIFLKTYLDLMVNTLEFVLFYATSEVSNKHLRMIQEIKESTKKFRYDMYDSDD